MKKLDRRTVLRGAGGVALALPWLEAMGLPGANVARAAGAKRFIVFFTPNGTIKDQWVPTGTESNWNLSRILKPLEPYKEYLTVLDGIDNVAATSGPGDGHQKGMGTMLTGTELLTGTVKGGCDTCPSSGYAGGISLDQEIAKKQTAKTKFPSLELGVQTGSRGTVWGYSNYAAANQPLPLENSPAKTFQRVFTDFQPGAGVDPNALARLRAERKSLLDSVAKHYQTIAAKVGAADKQKLDAHFTGVRELEVRLSAATPAAMGVACAKPAGPAATMTDFPMIGQTQMDLLVMSMACDLTRVGTIQWENSVGGAKFSWLGATRGHHDLSHDSDGVAESKEMLTKINVWFSEQLAYLMKKLKAVPEGTGSMLDNTLILWCNELARGNAHSHPDMPYVLAGKAGTALATNRYLKYDRVPHNNMMVSVLNAMDIPATTFGNPKFCTGRLAGL